MRKNKYSFGEKLKYSLDNFMSKGGLSVFMALIFLFIGAIILMAVLRFIVNLITPEKNMEDIFDQWWRSFLQIADGGSIAEDTDSNILNRIVGIVALFLGMVLFSSLVAFITSQFENVLENMRKGRSKVIESNHTLIVGFSDRALEIIREIIIANESEKNASIVVLSETEKDEMDDFFRERIEHNKTTRIITRNGSTSSIQLLKKVGVDKARSVIILNNAEDDASIEDKALADSRVLKTIMAVLSCSGEEKLPPIVAEIHLPNKQKLALNISDKVSIIDEHSILAKLMVQTSRISGLAQVYDHLVGFEGNEFYFYKPEKGFNSVSYFDIMFCFNHCSIIGIRTGIGKILLNPTKDTVLNDGDEIILLAEDDSKIDYLDRKINFNIPKTAPAPRSSKIIEKQLMVGWSHMAATIIDEYSNYLIEGSGIDVIVNEITDEIKSSFEIIKEKHKTITFNLINADIDNPDVLSEMKPEQYDNILILSGEHGVAELKDSETISKLLEFRHYFKHLGKKDLKTQLITEVADSENIEIIQETGVKDFLISNQFVSKIYAQVSEEPDILKVYEDLFREEGSEVYIKPLNRYLDKFPINISFGDLCAAAINRGESCFGVKILSEEENKDKNYGIYINPQKNEMFNLKEIDSLITLAEDET